MAPSRASADRRRLHRQRRGALPRAPGLDLALDDRQHLGLALMDEEVPAVEQLPVRNRCGFPRPRPATVPRWPCPPCRQAFGSDRPAAGAAAGDDSCRRAGNRRAGSAGSGSSARGCPAPLPAYLAGRAGRRSARRRSSVRRNRGHTRRVATAPRCRRRRTPAASGNPARARHTAPRRRARRRGCARASRRGPGGPRRAGSRASCCARLARSVCNGSAIRAPRPGNSTGRTASQAGSLRRQRL